MAVFAAGDVVLIRFPHSDLSQAKLRPAIVLADAGRGDYVLCQVTSNPYGDRSAVEITRQSFAAGALHATSYARPGKLFTAHSSLIRSSVASVNATILKTVVEQIVEMVRRGHA